MSPTSTRPLPRVHKSAFRVKIEHASDPLVRQLSSVPGAAVVSTFVVVLVAGLLLRGVVGGILIAVVALVHGWGIYLAWPRLSALERQMRLSVFMLIVALSVVCLVSGLR